MENKQKTLKYIQIAVFVVVAIVSIIYSLSVASNTEKMAISNDERNWTAVSISSYEMYFKGHMRPNVKMDSWFTTYAIENGIDTAAIPLEQKQWYDFAMWTFGWKAPNMGKYIMGAYVESAANMELDKNGYYELGRVEKQEDPKIYYSRVPEELVMLARKPNAIMNGLAIALVFLIGWLFLNWLSGFIASLYLLGNEVYMRVNSAAGLDSPSIFFWVLSVFFLIATIRYIFKNEKLWKTLLLALITGITFGFAIASKLNAAMFAYVCVWVFIVAGVAVIWARKPESESFFKSIFGTRLIALVLSSGLIVGTGYVLFVQLNPQIQGETWTKKKIVEDSVDEFFKRRANSQIAKNRAARKVLTDVTYKKPSKAFNLISRRNFMVDDTEKYYGTFGSLIKFKGNFLDGLLMIIGLVSLLWVGFNKFRKEKQVNGEWIILISFFVMLYGMCQFIWIDFARYHMAIYPGLALAIGYGIYTIADLINKRINKPKVVAQTPPTVKGKK